MPKFERNQLSYECFRASIIFVGAQLTAQLGNQDSARAALGPQPRPEVHREGRKPTLQVLPLSQIPARASLRHATRRALSASLCSLAWGVRGSSAAPQKAAGPDRSKSKCR